ncbi:unnamed protein product [Cylicocyclus nassatus]|uniref:Transmembrane protein n=1 Tax=Cylicocyclus nassatus TaxID=53992 RepID=A0AA36DJ09_CYLNA|nr:unnamed protein product [Cylicocyclus nassatus]
MGCVKWAPNVFDVLLLNNQLLLIIVVEQRIYRKSSQYLNRNWCLICSPASIMTTMISYLIVVLMFIVGVKSRIFGGGMYGGGYGYGGKYGGLQLA